MNDVERQGDIHTGIEEEKYKQKSKHSFITLCYKQMNTPTKKNTV